MKQEEYLLEEAREGMIWAEKIGDAIIKDMENLK